MKWTIKALIQRVLSRTLGGSYFYYLGQRYLYGFQKFRVEPKLQQGITILKCLSAIGETVEGKKIVEIGTGWAPVLPLLFWLLGYDKCITFDISRLLKESLVIESVRQLSNIASHPDGILDQIIINSIKSDRIMTLQELVKENAHQILENCHLSYCAPKDASSTGLPSESMDLVYSNVVLEHIPNHEIRSLFSEMYRILRPGAYTAHHIDLGDHFSHSDPSISGINFMQFSESAFSKYNSHFLFQNRLRISAYKQLIEQSGFSIVHEEKYINKKALQQFPKLQIHSDFSKYTPEELCTTNYRVVAMR
jgi:SAM-dependent methyltransferase